MVNGGNMWGQFICYLSGMRDIIGLDLPKLKPYEDCALEGGYRLMHEEFCIVCDFPKWIKKDEQNRPHSEVSSQMEWKDGFATYYLNGISFTKELWTKIVNKTIAPQEALKLDNAEQRAIAIKYIGGAKMIESLAGEKYAEDEYGELWKLKNMKDLVGDYYCYYRSVDPAELPKDAPMFSTLKENLEWCEKNQPEAIVYLRVDPKHKTPKEAMTDSYRLNIYNLAYAPEKRT